MAIISRPEDIISHIKRNFPEAKILGNVSGDRGFRLECNLVAGSQHFFIYKALDCKEFDRFLSVFEQSLKEKNFDPNVSIQMMSTGMPLEKWKVFQRGIFGEEKVVRVVREYLNSSKDESKRTQGLMQLGLAPVQIEQNCSVDDFQVFYKIYHEINTKMRELDAKMRESNAETSEESNEVTALNRLREKYPAVVNEIEKLLLGRVFTQSGTHFDMFLEKIKARVIGQNAAAKFLANALASQNNSDECHKFLFVGPSGVGKTEMARAIAILKGTGLSMISMNNYPDASSSGQFFGYLTKECKKIAPKKVSSEGGIDLYQIENAVILFDELEKAHRKVVQSLLTLLDGKNGHYTVTYETDGKSVTEKYIFKRSIFIGTSNQDDAYILESFEQNKDISVIEDDFKTRNKAAVKGNNLSPEIVSRFKVTPFGPIPKGNDYQKLLGIKLNWLVPDLQKQLKCQMVFLDNKPLLFEALEHRLYGKGADIRKIDDYFRNNVLSTARRALSSCRLDALSVGMAIDYQNGKIGIQFKFFTGEWKDCSKFFPIDPDGPTSANMVDEEVLSNTHPTHSRL
ncbi:hypothetical protein COB21_05700 [Candidatus Aerophobetes bacterium]|uniref:AAA+ ATPase domain-containing protein n=1 Tax=Aerophobetes bacterium TaxID=2030807 RepID=A0A2A4X026_UNCAE|nr:MAG: hypothetical protein COB21_05700 [Candidatus Aerophobetes bacterium]